MHAYHALHASRVLVTVCRCVAEYNAGRASRGRDSDRASFFNYSNRFMHVPNTLIAMCNLEVQIVLYLFLYGVCILPRMQARCSLGEAPPRHLEFSTPICRDHLSTSAMAGMRGEFLSYMLLAGLVFKTRLGM